MSEERTTNEEYGCFTTDDGETVVYDRHNPKAWIQSSFALTLGSADDTETTV